jgi:flagellar FliJ protein
MNKFKFKLEPVLKFKKLKEEESLRKLAIAQKKLQQLIMENRNLISILTIYTEKKQGSQVDILKIKIEENYVIGVKQRIVQSNQAISKAKREVDKTIISFLLSQKDRKKLEMLYEKDYREYRKQLDKVEQKRIDDLMLMRFRLKEEKL